MAPASELGLELVPAVVTQTLSETELIELLPQFDGWIIGDDPATQQVFEAGLRGSLKAAVKWGIGVDNVDFRACEALGIPITNTPGMFGGEVADVAVGYVIALARHTVEIDRSVREGSWPKPRGLSLAGRHGSDRLRPISGSQHPGSWREPRPLARTSGRGGFCSGELRTHRIKPPHAQQ